VSGEGDPIFEVEPSGSTETYTPEGQMDYEPTYLNSSGGKNQASRNQAKLARSEWDDYKTRFVPIENELIGQIGDPSVYRENVGRATDSVSDTYATGAGEFERNMSRYGVQPNAEEKAQTERQYGLSRATAMTEAANRTRASVKDREMQLMGGGLAPSNLRSQQG